MARVTPQPVILRERSEPKDLMQDDKVGLGMTKYGSGDTPTCHPERAQRTEGSHAGWQRKVENAVNQGDPSATLRITK